MNPEKNYISIDCPVCNSAESREIYPDTIGDASPNFDYNFGKDHNRTYRLLQCRKCGHGYCSPRLKDFSVHYRDVVDEAYLRNKIQRQLTASNVLKKLKRYSSGTRLLDVGCATGDFLEVASHAYTVEGLEVSQWSARIAREKGLTVHEALLEDFKSQNLYDVVTLWGVIEHFEQPNIVIGQIVKILKPGGIVALWTGDFDCLLSKVLRKKWWWIQGQHINVFTKKSLNTLFENHGFKPVYSDVYPYVLTAQSLKTSLGRYPLISGVANKILGSNMVNQGAFTLKIPGEMFAIYKVPLLPIIDNKNIEMVKTNGY